MRFPGFFFLALSIAGAAACSRKEPERPSTTLYVTPEVPVQGTPEHPARSVSDSIAPTTGCPFLAKDECYVSAEAACTAIACPQPSCIPQGDNPTQMICQSTDVPRSPGGRP
jgi:hypothetical protein